MIISKKRYEQAIREAEERVRNELWKENSLDIRLGEIRQRIEECFRYVDRKFEAEAREEIATNGKIVRN